MMIIMMMILINQVRCKKHNIGMIRFMCGMKVV